MQIGLLTVSDTRNFDNDTSGQLLAHSATTAGHVVTKRKITPDDVYAIRAIVSEWIYAPDVDIIILTGGTGFSGRDSTPEALVPLFDKEIPGFGELFRSLSYQDIGSSTIQSRAVAGLANSKIIFALPGSTNACKLAWDKILLEQLHASFKPCNFAELIPKLRKTKESE